MKKPYKIDMKELENWEIKTLAVSCAEKKLYVLVKPCLSDQARYEVVDRRSADIFRYQFFVEAAEKYNSL